MQIRDHNIRGNKDTKDDARDHRALQQLADRVPHDSGQVASVVIEHAEYVWRKYDFSPGAALDEQSTMPFATSGLVAIRVVKTERIHGFAPVPES
jgi:hypothetical protein